MKYLLKLIVINVAIFFSILGFILFAPPLAYFLFNFSKKIFFLEDSIYLDNRFLLPNYEKYEWAKEYFLEDSRLMTSYKDYIIWQFDDYNGNQINIKNGERRTINSKKLNKKTSVSFYGGSAIFGTGSNDSNTIPSLFSKKSNYYVNNYGNLNYVARQSYEKLFNKYSLDLDEENIIIFYDGVNDIDNFCRADISEGLNQTSLESLMQDQFDLKTRPSEKYSFKQMFFQISSLIQSLKRRYLNLTFDLSEETNFLYYNCHIDKKKAENIAKNLVNIWEKASLLASSNNDIFIAILQPNIFIGNSKIDHLDLGAKNLIELRKQFLTVYPLIIKHVKNKNINFYNFTNVFNDYNDDYIYIDYCHVSPNGNFIVAEELVAKINNLKLN